MAQKPYTTTPDIGIAGGISATGGEQRIVPIISDVALNPGVAVCFDGGNVTNVGTGRNFAGIVTNNATGGGDDITDDSYAADTLVPVMDRGSVFCTLTGSTDAVVGAPVYRVILTGLITAASGTANAVIPNARFESAGSTGALVDVRLG